MPPALPQCSRVTRRPLSQERVSPEPPDPLAAAQLVDLVRHHAVLLAGAAVHDIALVVAHVDRVVARAAADLVAAGTGGDAIVPGASAQRVVALAARNGVVASAATYAVRTAEAGK